MIKAIIFDYYGVLTTDSYLTWLQRNPAVTANHAAEIEALSHDQDTGISDDEFFGRLSQISGQRETDIRTAFAIHGVAHVGLISYIRHLRRKGLKTAILSNSDIGLYELISKHHWNRLFELILCSEEAGVTKPHPQIYEMALRRLGVSPDEAVFVDDRAYNVDGAEKANISGIIYTGLTDFRDELVRLGIDTPN